MKTNKTLELLTHIDKFSVFIFLIIYIGNVPTALADSPQCQEKANRLDQLDKRCIGGNGMQSWCDSVPPAAKIKQINELTEWLQTNCQPSFNPNGTYTPWPK